MLLAFSLLLVTLRESSWNRLRGSFCSSRGGENAIARKIVQPWKVWRAGKSRPREFLGHSNRLHSLARGVPKVDVKRTSGTTVSNSTLLGSSVDGGWREGEARVNVNRRNESLPWSATYSTIGGKQRYSQGKFVILAFLKWHGHVLSCNEKGLQILRSRFDDFIDLHGWMMSFEDSRASKLINMLMDRFVERIYYYYYYLLFQ